MHVVVGYIKKYQKNIKKFNKNLRGSIFPLIFAAKF